MNNERVYRVIDANLNRLREGLRVVEDIYRYVFDQESLCLKTKTIRHKIRLDESKFILLRDAKNDVLKPSTKSEKERSNLNQIIIANLKRAQESARVLEECLKLFDDEKSELFKQIRYELYELESEIYKSEN